MKRPVGQAKSETSKKLKQEQNEIFLEMEESLDEMDQLKNLYEAALASFETDPALLHGCIHECDKMVRVRHSKVDADPKELELLNEYVKKMPVLPQLFHLIYANCLFFLSISNQDCDRNGFLEASIERYIVISSN